MYLTSDYKFFYPSRPGTSDPVERPPSPPSLAFPLDFMTMCMSGGVISEDPEGLKAQFSL